MGEQNLTDTENVSKSLKLLHLRNCSTIGHNDTGLHLFKIRDKAQYTNRRPKIVAMKPTTFGSIR
jgi:hypothetical protein